MKQEERDSEAEKRFHGANRKWFDDDESVFSFGLGKSNGERMCVYIVVWFLDRRLWGDDVDQ